MGEGQDIWKEGGEGVLGHDVIGASSFGRDFAFTSVLMWVCFTAMMASLYHVLAC